MELLNRPCVATGPEASNSQVPSIGICFRDSECSDNHGVSSGVCASGDQIEVFCGLAKLGTFKWSYT